MPSSSTTPTARLIIASVGVLIAFATIEVSAADKDEKKKPTPDELLVSGRYREIPEGTDAHSKGLWAFAQFHLAPSGIVFDVAWEVHKKGEILGTFVAWQCHKGGIGARRDEEQMWKLHFDLRMRLEKKKDPTPLELYILSHLDPVDENGVMKLPEGTNITEFEDKNKKRKSDFLESAINGGFAEACYDRGMEFQKAGKTKQALQWYDKAAQLGLAAGMRSKGYMMMVGKSNDDEAKEAFLLGIRGAEAGDAFAMINAAVYFDRGWGTSPDKKKAQLWVNKAVESGHWIGLIDRGLAYHNGYYGLDIDTKAGVSDWKKALSLRHREVLDFLAKVYTEAPGVKPNGKRAAFYAEAAFVQGSPNAARLLAYIYNEGIGGLEKNEQLKTYWGVQSTPNHAFALADTLQKLQPELTERLKKLDPWKWDE